MTDLPVEAPVPIEAPAAAIRVLIVDDQALFRRGLHAVLDIEDGIEVVGEAENGPEAISMAQQLVPDVILMDVRMPLMGGVEATTRVRELLPSAQVLILTVSDDEDDLFGAIRAGASGYLLKEISVEEVAAAVRSVHDGHSLISPSMASKLFKEFALLSRRVSEQVQVPSPVLTAREHEVLGLMAQSKSNREIAEALFISENTVKNHVRNILEKLHLHSRMEAVLYAWQKHLLDPPA